MSSAPTVSRSDGRIIIHYTLEIMNVVSTLEIGLDVDISRQLSTYSTPSFQTPFNMDYGQ